MNEPRWRVATERDDAEIIALAVALYEEDPSTAPVPPEHTQRTLAELRRAPTRGRAVVLDAGSGPEGYALLVSFWSNERGGEVCTIDEILVASARRGQGHAGRLMRALAHGCELWPGVPVAMELEVSPKNRRARALYERLGFVEIRNARLRWRRG